MAKVLSSIAFNAPAAPVTANVSDTFAFTGTPGFTGTGGVQRYDFKWEVDDGGGYVTIAASGTGLITSGTNPIINTNAQTAQSITVTCDQVGTYTIRMVGAPTSGGSYTVLSTTETVTVSVPQGGDGNATLTLGALGFAADGTYEASSPAQGGEGNAVLTLAALGFAASGDYIAPVTGEAGFSLGALGFDADGDYEAPPPPGAVAGAAVFALAALGFDGDGDYLAPVDAEAGFTFGALGFAGSGNYASPVVGEATFPLAALGFTGAGTWAATAPGGRVITPIVAAVLVAHGRRRH